MEPNFPKLHSVWTHFSGAVYRVYDLVNEFSDTPDYPPMICFVGADDKRWAIELDRFYDNFTPQVIQRWDERKPKPTEPDPPKRAA